MKLIAGSNHSNGGYISLAVSQAPMISAPRRKTTMPQILGSRFHLKGSHSFFSFPHIKIFPDNLVKVHFLIKVLHYRRNDLYMHAMFLLFWNAWKTAVLPSHFHHIQHVSEATI